MATKVFDNAELLKRFNKRSQENQIKILNKALKRSCEQGGSYHYNIALAMGYRMSADYTGWTTSKTWCGTELG